MSNIKLTKDDIVINLWAETDDTRIISDSFSDPSDAALVWKRINDGVEWAWVTVFLAVTWSPFTNAYYWDDEYDGDYQGLDTLGAVSADSKAHFMSWMKDEYQDMIDVALDNLNDKLASYNEEKIIKDMVEHGDFSDRELNNLEKRYPGLMMRYWDALI